MPLNIMSNYAAQVAHRNLSSNEAATTASLSKLSSGSRVVSAKDDAASLAIGSRISTEVAALKQASVNAGQATSMLQIADGAMSKVGDILTRMKTLAVQAGSDQVGTTERSMLDTEYQSLLGEIDRIAQDTEFNGQTLVNGSTSSTTLINGQGTNNLVNTAAGFSSIKFDSGVGDSAFAVEFDSTSNVMTVTNLVTGHKEGVDIGATQIATNTTQDVRFEESGVSITLNSAFDKGASISASGGAFSTASTGAIETGTIKLTGAAVVDPTVLQGLNSLQLTIGSAGDAAATANLTLGAFTSSDVDLSTLGTKSATLSDGAGTSFTVEFVVTQAFANADVAGTGTLDVNGLGSLVNSQAATSTTTDLSFKIGTGNHAQDSLSISINSINTTALGVNGTSLTGADATNADAASAAISTAIDTLNTSRANVGASQNRLEFASSNLASTIENQEAARSALLDLDVASEMTKFTSKQILVQAGVSMLAQANQMPQNLMRLFG